MNDERELWGTTDRMKTTDWIDDNCREDAYNGLHITTVPFITVSGYLLLFCHQICLVNVRCKVKLPIICYGLGDSRLSYSDNLRPDSTLPVAKMALCVELGQMWPSITSMRRRNALFPIQ